MPALVARQPDIRRHERTDTMSNLFIKSNGVMVPVAGGFDFQGEYGENANGAYVKYPNGVMDQWNAWQVDNHAVDTTLGTSGLYVSNFASPPLDWTFPVPFVGETPSGNSTAVYGTNATWATMRNLTLVDVDIRCVATGSLVAGTVNVTARAIGRWKA
jgi:hypothetical protein